MQTVMQHDNDIKIQHRPNLTINTSFNKKKKGWHQLFTNHLSNKTATDGQGQRTLLKRNSLPSSYPSPSTSPVRHHSSTSISLAPILRRKTASPTANSTNSTGENISDESNSSHTVTSPFKKFHLPSFHKRNNSHHTLSSINDATASLTSTAQIKEEKEEEDHYTPNAPEHIMPTLVNWSPEAPVSPPPWELNDPRSLYHQQRQKKRHSVSNHRHSYNNLCQPTSLISSDIAIGDYHSDSETTINKPLQRSPSDSTDRSSNVTLIGLTSVVVPSISSTDDGSSSLAATETAATTTAALRVRRRSSCPTYDALSLSAQVLVPRKR